VSNPLTTSCLNEELRAIDNAHKREGLPALGFNLDAFKSLSAAEQLFVITDVERTARDLPPVRGLTSQLNREAAQGANSGNDPALSSWTLDGNHPVTAWVSNWAGGLGVLGADYFWMYDDGVGFNAACITITSPGCWAHRNNVLIAESPASSCAGSSKTSTLLMGVADDTTGYHGTPSVAQLIVTSCGGLPPDTSFTWAAAKRLLSIRTK
jgi:hypothetical protein